MFDKIKKLFSDEKWHLVAIYKTTATWHKGEAVVAIYYNCYISTKDNKKIELTSNSSEMAPKVLETARNLKEYLECLYPWLNGARHQKLPYTFSDYESQILVQELTNNQSVPIHSFK